MQTLRWRWVPTASSAKRLRHSIPNAQWHVQEQLEGGGLDPIAQSSRRPTYLSQRMKYPTWGQNPMIQNKSWNCKIVQREGPRVWMSTSWNGKTTTSKDCQRLQRVQHVAFASLHYPLGSQKQDERAGRANSSREFKTVYRGPREDPHRREVTQEALPSKAMWNGIMVKTSIQKYEKCWWMPGAYWMRPVKGNCKLYRKWLKRSDMFRFLTSIPNTRWSCKGPFRHICFEKWERGKIKYDPIF